MTFQERKTKEERGAERLKLRFRKWNRERRLIFEKEVFRKCPATF
jgi:hypothetical protein